MSITFTSSHLNYLLFLPNGPGDQSAVARVYEAHEDARIHTAMRCGGHVVPMFGCCRDSFGARSLALICDRRRRRRVEW